MQCWTTESVVGWVQITANCIIIAQFPIGNHSEQEQFARICRIAPENNREFVQNLGDY